MDVILFQVFQPMLLEYFTYEELCELKRKVIDYHTRKADDIIEKGLIEETEKEESSDSCKFAFKVHVLELFYIEKYSFELNYLTVVLKIA